MDAVLPHFRMTPPRLSPGVLAAVVLVHLGALAAVLALLETPSASTPPAPLYVRLIEPATAPAETATPANAPALAPRRPPESAPASPSAPTAKAAGAAIPPVRTEIAQPAPAPSPQPAPAPAAPASAAALPATPAPVAAQGATEASQPTSAPAVLPVTQPRFNAEYLDNPKPPYPGLSRRMGEEGEVRLKVYVDANGTALQIELYRSSGFPRLDQSARDTVRQWRFVPARQGEQTVPAWIIVPIRFSLDSV